MKTRALMAALVVAVCAASGKAAMTNAQVGTRAVAIVSATDLDAALADRVAHFVGRSLHVSVQSCAVEIPRSSLAACAESVRAACGSGAGAAIGLVSLSSSNYAHLVSSATGSVAVLNVAALKVNGARSTNDTELFSRRVEKEAVAALARVMGLKSCPNPACALFPHQSELELDQKGRGLCPPCQVRAEQAMAKMDIILLQPKMVPTSARGLAP